MKRYWYVSLLAGNQFIGTMYESDGEFAYSEFDKIVCERLKKSLLDICIMNVRETSKEDYDAFIRDFKEDVERKRKEGEQVKG